MTAPGAGVLHASLLGQAAFWALAAAATAAALAAVLSQNPIRAAMGLLGNILSLAGLFVLLRAHLVAALQVLVYAGAIVVLFVFVIMLLGPSASPPRDRRATVSRIVAVLLIGFVGWRLVPLVWRMRPLVRAPAASFGTIEALGAVLFGPYTLLFEAVGVLLLIAILGAVAVARGKQA